MLTVISLNNGSVSFQTDSAGNDVPVDSKTGASLEGPEGQKLKAEHDALKNGSNHGTSNNNHVENDDSNNVTPSEIIKAEKKAKHHKKIIKERKLKKQKKQKLATAHGLLLIAGGIAIAGVLIAWVIDKFRTGRHFKH